MYVYTYSRMYMRMYIRMYMRIYTQRQAAWEEEQKAASIKASQYQEEQSTLSNKLWAEEKAALGRERLALQDELQTAREREHQVQGEAAHLRYAIVRRFHLIGNLGTFSPAVGLF
jgi:biopolymer transport protein ExbB/TolQ